MRRMMTMMMAVTLMSGAAIAAAHPAKEYRSRVRDRAAEQLRLSEEQREEFKALRHQLQKERILAEGKMAELRSRMQAEMMETELKRKEILNLHREISRIEQELAGQEMEMHLNLLEAMTLEQRLAWQSSRKGRELGRRARELGHEAGIRHLEMLDRKLAIQDRIRNRMR